MEASSASKPHNKRLESILIEVKLRAEGASSDDELITAIKRLEQFPEPVAYDNQRLNMFASIFAALFILIGAALYFIQVPEEYLFVPLGGLVLVLVIYGSFWHQRRASFDKLSDRIHFRSTLFDYNLQEIRVHAPDKAKELAGRFTSFRKGNHQRLIEQWLEGKHEGEENSFNYNYYHFHYVDRRRVTTTDSKGNVRTKTVYDHHHRYGFIVPFRYARNIDIAEKYLKLFQTGYKTSSISFNKKFSVNFDSEMEVVKFLKPAVLQAIEAAGDALSEIVLEFNDSGDLCFSFGNSDTIRINREFSLKQPKEFAAEIEGKASQPRLTAALAFIEKLMKYSDDNFS
ncbi:hypothetical protein KFE96_05840 [Kordiimonas sp. SCSIO 12603]|uniref:hypothetical protein n=1 Tax=Kordiimonas sp. SCSIO 12603 TaxID=2829596 RepID=UPI002106328E|nr:hypothetical protein [Kordiimonas sp. SCSIO 12603]UTW59824.1 hypothetical protein KFE96_05840 [Kordiimonas sp. SCSIO 12603]